MHDEKVLARIEYIKAVSGQGQRLFYESPINDAAVRSYLDCIEVRYASEVPEGKVVAPVDATPKLRLLPRSRRPFSDSPYHSPTRH